MTTDFVDAGGLEEFPSGTVSPRVLGSRTVLICHTPEGLFAVTNRCTHVAWPLDDAPLEQCEIVCALHGARFDVRSGEATLPPASKPLETFELEVRERRVLVRMGGDSPIAAPRTRRYP